MVTECDKQVNYIEAARSGECLCGHGAEKPRVRYGRGHGNGCALVYRNVRYTSLRDRTVDIKNTDVSLDTNARRRNSASDVIYSVTI